MIDEVLFWRYVSLWIRANNYSYSKLAVECGMSRSSIYRKKNRVGGSELSVSEFSCICQGIGLMPEMVLVNNRHYGEPFLTTVEMRV